MTELLPSTDVISADQLRQLIATDPLVRILDVRTGGEFETSHIPGSYNVPLDTLSEHANDLAALTHPVVLICQSGGRASQAHTTLVGEGKESLHILEGGMNAWQDSDGELVRGSVERWAMDRQVRFVAGSIALGAVLASAVVPGAKWIAAGVGGGLTYSGVSNTCAMANVLGRLPYNRTDKCDIAGVISDMNAHTTSSQATRKAS